MQRATSLRKRELTNAATTVRVRRESQVDPAAIRARAFEIYLASGSPSGQELAHWAQAERELRGRLRATR